MRRSFFVLNPASGSKQGMKIRGTIDDLWTQNGIWHEIYVTKDHGDIASAVKTAIAKNATEIIIVGGDGTLLAVVNALEGVAIPIGIIPCGTGNDFARTQGLPMQVEAALFNVLGWNIKRPVDIGRSSGSYFLNVASIGIDASIVKRTGQIRKWARGPAVYFLSSLIEIVNYKPLVISLCIDGIEYERTIELVAVANGCYYGGGMKIAPMANPTDGVYDVVLANKMSRLRLIQLLPKLYTGSHIGEPEIEIFHGRNIKISALKNTPINLDGELTEGNHLIVNASDSKIDIVTKI